MEMEMENLILVDSNVYIDLLRVGRDPATEIGALCNEWDLVTCGMIKLEVLRAVHTKKGNAKLSKFFAIQRFVISDNRLWDESIELARSLAQQGVTLPGPDLVIAASAFRVGAAVLTADKHFSLIPNLHVIPSPFHQ